MDGRYTPEDGDIVIREEKRDGARLYIVLRASDAEQTAPDAEQSVPDIPQSSVLPIREEAVAQALRSAESLRVRVWLADGHDDFTLIEDFRAN